MKIYSKFNDYYDNIMLYEQDPLVVFNRKTSEYKISFDWKSSLKLKIPFENTLHNKVDIYIKFIVVCFCGKFYPLAVFKESEYYLENILEVVYDINNYNTVLNTNYKKYKRYNSWINRNDTPEQFFKDSFSHFGNPCVDNNSPIIVIYREKDGLKYIINPELANIKFFKVLNPYEAFQQIEMYISGVLGIGAPNTIEISDKDKLHKKGFDNKSFKQVSPGKKYNRRNK